MKQHIYCRSGLSSTRRLNRIASCTTKRNQYSVEEKIKILRVVQNMVDENRISYAEAASAVTVDPSMISRWRKQEGALGSIKRPEMLRVADGPRAILSSIEADLLEFIFTRLDCSGKLSALNDLLRHAGIAEPEITGADNDDSGYLIDLSGNNSDNGSDIGMLENDNVDFFDDNPSGQGIETSKCLVFAQFTQSLDIVEQMLFEPHMPSLRYLRLDGRVPEKQRSAVVDRFNQDPDIKVLLLTTKVGGLGLNLTGESSCYF